MQLKSFLSDLRVAARPVRGAFWILICLALLVALSEFALVGALVGLAGAVLNQPPPGVLRMLQPWLANAEGKHLVLLAAVSFLSVLLVRFALAIGFEMLAIYFRGKAIVHLEEHMLWRYLSAPLTFYHGAKQGRMAYMIPALSHRNTEAMVIIMRLLATIATLTLLSIFLLALEPMFFLFIVFLGTATGVVVTIMARKGVLPGVEAKTLHARRKVEIATETAGGIKEIRYLQAEKAWAEEFLAASKGYVWGVNRTSRYQFMPGKVVELMVLAGFGLSVALTATLSDPATLFARLPTVAGFAYGVMRIYPSINGLNSSYMDLVSATPFVRDLRELSELPDDRLGHPGKDPPRIRHGISVQDVHVTYSDGRTALQGVTFDAPAGQTTAIVGPSGGGKSTLAATVLKLLAPTQGRILIDGIDLSEVDRRGWLRRIGYVSQDVFLFHRSIRENLRLGNPNAADDEILRACREAGLDRFVDRLPQGLDTLVGNRGLEVSGGERQRIAIARALLSDPDILLLDEPTSSLDHQTEARIMETIRTVGRNRTVLLITHRMGLARTADKVVVIVHGRVHESGTHEQLMSRNSVYASFQKPGLEPPVRERSSASALVNG